MDLLGGQCERCKHLDKCTAGKRIVRHIAGQRGDSHVGARRQQERGEVVGAQGAMHIDAAQLAVLRAERPARIPLHRAVDECVVLGQFLGCTGHATLAQIGWGGSNYPGVVPQVACAQGGVGESSHADRKVHALRHKIHIPVLEAHVDVYAGMAAHEADNPWRQNPTTEGDRGADPDRPLHLRLHERSHCVSLFHMVQDQQTFLVEERADLCGRHAPRRAVQKACTEALLELGEHLACARLADAEITGRPGEGPQLDQAGEKAQAVDAVHSCDDRRLVRTIPRWNEKNAASGDSCGADVLPHFVERFAMPSVG